MTNQKKIIEILTVLSDKLDRIEERDKSGELFSPELSIRGKETKKLLEELNAGSNRELTKIKKEIERLKKLLNLIIDEVHEKVEGVDPHYGQEDPRYGQEEKGMYFCKCKECNKWKEISRLLNDIKEE